MLATPPSTSGSVGANWSLMPLGYEPGVHNWLRSPDIHLTSLDSGDRVFLRFQRWSSVQNYFKGSPPPATPLDFTELFILFPQPGPPPVELWQNHRGVPHVDNARKTGEWVPFEVEITGAVTGFDSVRIEWSLRTDGDGDPDSIYGGWTIDDVEVVVLKPVL